MVDTTNMHWYPEGQVRDILTGELIPNATGQARLTAGGDPLTIYDASGNQLVGLTADGYGVCEGFFADTGGADVLYDFNARQWWESSKTNIKLAAKVPAMEDRIASVEGSITSQVLSTENVNAVASAAASQVRGEFIGSDGYILPSFINPATVGTGTTSGTTTSDADFAAAQTAISQAWLGTGVTA